MRALWVYASRYLRIGDAVYNHGALDYEHFSRYLNHFSELVVVGRRADPGKDSAKFKAISSGPGVVFRLLDSRSFDYISPARPWRRALLEEVKKADLVIVRVPSPYALVAIDCAKELKKTVVVEVVGCAWDAIRNVGGILPRLLAPLAYLHQRSAVANAHFVTYVTTSFLQSRYPSRKGVPCASISDVRLSVLASDTSSISTRMDRPARHLGLIGSLQVGFKGHATALKALRLLEERGYGNLRLHLLGQGSEQKIRSLAEREGVAEMLQFDGMVSPGQAVWDWLDGIDIYLQPSLQEGLPRALVEAMSRGCPAIASTAGGIPELLAGDCLHEPRDFQRLAGLIERGITDQQWLHEWSRKNIATASAFCANIMEAKRNHFWDAVRESLQTGRNPRC